MSNLWEVYYDIMRSNNPPYVKGHEVSAIKRIHFQSKRLEVLEMFINDNDIKNLTLNTIKYIDNKISKKSSNFNVYAKTFDIQDKSSSKYFYDNKLIIDSIDMKKYIAEYNQEVFIINQEFKSYKVRYKSL